MKYSEEELKGLKFYEANYARIGYWLMKKGHREFLGNRDVRVCRFCRKSNPHVSFRKDAHVVPQLLGNRSLMSFYECDACNKKFGDGIENDLGNWTKPDRLMLRVSNGQSGIPTIKGKGPKGWRIEGKHGHIEIQAHREDMPNSDNEDNRTITFDLPRDPYTPSAVMKAFVRIGLTLMPELELANFEDLMEWIQNSDHAVRTIGNYEIYETIHSGPLPNDEIQASLLRRADDKAVYPYMFLILAFANYVYQVPLISRIGDAHLQGKTFTLPLFPSFTHLDREVVGHPRKTTIDLSETTEVRGERKRIVMRYGQKEERHENQQAVAGLPPQP